MGLRGKVLLAGGLQGLLAGLVSPWGTHAGAACS